MTKETIIKLVESGNNAEYLMVIEWIREGTITDVVLKYPSV